MLSLLCVKLESLNIKLSLPDARYEKNEKKIKISVDGKVKWSYKWTSTFAPPLGQDLLTTLSSTVKVSLSGKHRFGRHALGSYSSRIVDFLLLDPDKPLILEDDRYGACATITTHLSPVVDYQKALSASLDASLARLDANPRLAEGLDDVDQAASAMETMNYAVETSGQYIVPLGQALRLMIKLIDNVAEAHPFLKVGWALLSSVYTAVQQQRLDDRDVQGLAESLRELVGVAGDCPVADIKGTPDVIPSIARLALDVASLIDEYTKSPLIVRLGQSQITGVRARIKQCQVDVQALHEKLRTRILAYIAKRAEETQERVKQMDERVMKMDERVTEVQKGAERRDVQMLWDQIREWLKPHDSSINHKSARDACVKGTGAWFAKDERFQTWFKEPGRTLWIPGARDGIR
ncbi:hypothetical protein BDN67DRAFT_1072304 [Paxillus ammoniavirescens]|nr:hypothetical protein BDN67DRAFT_1072304 [Paxillus ammoniavirescens]